MDYEAINNKEKYLSMNAKYISAPKKNDTIAVIIKDIEEDFIYFIDEQIVYKAKILLDGEKKFFRFLHKRFYFEDFMKLY